MRSSSSIPPGRGRGSLRCWRSAVPVSGSLPLSAHTGTPTISVASADAAIMGRAIVDMREMWGFDHEVPPAPDRLLNEGDVVAFGDVELQVMATPGHTPGGIVLFCAATTGDVAFVGDTLFPGAHGRTDLEGGSEKQIIDSLGKIGALLPADTLCLIGHNDTTTVARELETNLFMRRGLRHYR